MKIYGNVIFDANVDYSDVTEIVGGLYCRGSDTSAAFPALTSIGGGLDCSGSDTSAAFPLNPKIGDRQCPAKRICATALFASFASVGILFADGISAKRISSRSYGDAVVHSVIIVGKTKTSFVIERSGMFSHGETLVLARESLIYKVSDRDTQRFSGWSAETEISLEDAIASYRAITGACKQGTRNFCAQQKLKLKNNYTVGEVIDLTKGAYGHDTYKQFFQGGNQ